MSERGQFEVDLEWGARITLRDGVQLNATVYRPYAKSEPAPVIVAMTPYVADTYHERGVYFASHGFTFAIVDVRGRGNSGGEFRPLVQEAADGYDVIESFARQPYCNGKVAMWGGSYSGYCQWAAAKEQPPHLATVVPAAAPYAGVDFPMRNNIFYPYLVQWLSFTSARTAQTQVFGDRSFWSSVYRRWHRSGRPFRELANGLFDQRAAFEEWLEHPEQDAYWDSYNPTPAQYAAMRLPVLTITGSYDDDQLGALEHYRRHLQSASAAAQAQHYLIIGPWDHAGTRTPKREFGGLTFAPESLVDLPKLHLEWYRWTMGGGPKPEFLRAPVAYYVMGAEQWRYANALGDITTGHRTLYLETGPTGASDTFASGLLQTAPGRGDPDRYTYDPRQVDGAEVEAEARSDPTSLVDQRTLMALRGRALVYHSEPFTEDTEVSGFFRLLAWIGIDCPDTDIYVSVHEIDLAGGSVRLTTDATRARYREGLRCAKLIGTKDPLRYEFQRFTFVSREVKRGHRLRLVIAPIGRIVESTFVQKNYNAGGRVSEESLAVARPVTVRVFHDEEHPSALYVPIGQTVNLGSL
jgi:putative CocE/NonD family hydrolase